MKRLPQRPTRTDTLFPYSTLSRSLGAGDLVASRAVRLGARADEAEVGAAVRLGEAHGARPAAVRHVREKGPLLRLAAVHLQGVAGTVGQTGVHAEGEVGRADQLGHDEQIGRAAWRERVCKAV